jgi:DNA-binding transcriptional LysR family regulator
LPSTLRVLDEVRDLRAGLGTRGSAREREVSVVLDATFEWPRWIDTLAIFRAKFPSVDLRIRTETTGHVAAIIANGLADFGVLEAAESRAAALHTATELTLPSIAVVARTHPLATRTAPLTGASLRGHVQLVLCDRLGLLTARGHNVLSKRTWRVSDLATKHALLKAGVGWGYLPRHVVMPDLRGGTLVAMTFAATDEAAAASRTMVIAHREAQTLGPAARWLADGLASALE